MSVLHDPAQVLMFVAFSAVVAGTPGPSNTLLTAAGARAGIRRGLPSLFGQVAGMGVMLFAVMLGLGDLLLAHPLVLEILKWCGVAMLCWMAWRIATDDHAEPAADGPAGFSRMAVFQWFNPKGWLVAAAATATFLDKHSGALGQAATLAALFTLTALPCCMPWLMFGAALRRYLSAPRTRRVVNGVMAVLLVASVLPLAWTRY